jgi:hypothetical protein
MLIPEPETMTPFKKGGSRAAACAAPEHTPPHYLRRVARTLVIRAALRGRLSWPVALIVLNQIGGGAA